MGIPHLLARMAILELEFLHPEISKIMHILVNALTSSKRENKPFIPLIWNHTTF